MAMLVPNPRILFYLARHMLRKTLLMLIPRVVFNTPKLLSQHLPEAKLAMIEKFFVPCWTCALWGALKGICTCGTSARVHPEGAPSRNWR